MPIDTQMCPVARAQMVRIYQLHLETHPRRIASHWHVSVNGVRKVWRECPTDEMAPLSEALAAFHAPIPPRRAN